jgi:hypothetical protein
VLEHWHDVLVMTHSSFASVAEAAIVGTATIAKRSRDAVMVLNDICEVRNGRSTVRISCNRLCGRGNERVAGVQQGRGVVVMGGVRRGGSVWCGGYTIVYIVS